MNAVSYTHLDVYKRQMLDNVDVLLLLPEFYLKNNGNKPVTISPYANITSYIDGVEVTDGSVLDIAVLDKDCLLYTSSVSSFPAASAESATTSAMNPFVPTCPHWPISA